LSQSPLLLRGRAVTRSFGNDLSGDFTLRSIDIDLRAGEILTVAGAAGAGKTTLLQCLCGLLRPQSGRIEVCGDAVKPGSCPPQVAYVPAAPVYYPFLTPRDVLELSAMRSNPSSRSSGAVDRAIARLDLMEVESSTVASLPRHVIRRLAVAEALVGNPEIILMDTTPADLVTLEPVVLGCLKGKADAGCAVMLATRDISAVVPVTTRLMLLDRGRASRTFALESLGEAIVTGLPAHLPRLVAERVH
jgi:ABC-type multidrug transport system ATPase subunit